MANLNPSNLEAMDIDIPAEEPTLEAISKGTVEHNGVRAQFFEFTDEDSIFQGLFNSDAPTDKSPNNNMTNGKRNNNNNNNNNNDKKNGDADKTAVRKAILAAILKNMKGKDKDTNPKPNDPYKDITLDSVGGLKTQIAWLKQCILKSLKNKNGNKWGIKPPKGLLFYGAPGTGKTLLARAFGNELSKELDEPVKFFHRKGGDCFSQWFGESSENLRNLFEEAIAEKPSVIFFDELDGLCPSRDSNTSSEAYNSVVTTLLGLMDTLPVGEVFVIGATNRLEAVDPAMRRPGRFDKHLEFLLPDQMARKEILVINTRKWKSQPRELQLEKLSQSTVGFTGADIENLCREAFFVAFERHIPDPDDQNATTDDMQVFETDWDKALEKVKPTNIAVYGSTLYSPVLPKTEVNHLISNIQAEILTKLIPMLPPTGAHNNNKDNPITVSSFILWDKNSRSVDVIESMILPGVFVHEKIATFPVYILSQENIQSQTRTTKLSYIKETINQALDSFIPCILYIPRLDDMIQDMRNEAPDIRNKLLELRGKSVLLLATSSRQPFDVPTVSELIWNLFGEERSFYVRKPSKEERINFFSPILTKITTSKDKEAALLETCVGNTHNDGIELILGLRDQILKTCSKHNVEKGSLVEDIQQLLKRYADNKQRY